MAVTQNPLPAERAVFWYGCNLLRHGDMLRLTARFLEAVGGQRAAEAADIDIAQGVDLAVAIAQAIEGVGAQAPDRSGPVDPGEGAAGLALLINDLEDRVVERFLPAPDGTLEQGAVIEPPTRLQSHTLEGLVPGVVVDDVIGWCDSRGGKRLGQVQCARHGLLDVSRLGDQTDFAVLAEAAADTGGQTALTLVALLTVAVGLQRCERDAGRLY